MAVNAATNLSCGDMISAYFIPFTFSTVQSLDTFKCFVVVVVVVVVVVTVAAVIVMCSIVLLRSAKSPRRDSAL